MSLQYILGGAGTGKSTLLLERLIRSADEHPGQRHIILVPEQYTMQTQRNVIRMHPDHAIMNIDILSFERLAYRIMGELGCEDTTILTSMGKNMMLRRICTEHKDELVVYRRSLRKPGFISRLMTMMSEFYQYGVTEEQLEKLQPKLDSQPMLSRKMKDLRVFYGAMEEMKGDNTMAAEELLTLLSRLLTQSQFLKGAYIAMDCFTGFTPVQYEILARMFPVISHMEMALLLPEEEWKEESRESDLFHMSQETIIQMDVLARNAGIVSEYSFCREDHRHREHPELAFLSSEFLRHGDRVWEKQPDDLELISLRNPREEAQVAAERIRQLVMTKGLRYRDIAVVTGDLEEYRPYLETFFRRYSIPAFLDRRRGILGNPLVEFLRSCLDVIRSDMSYESMFRFLKSGITILEAEELDVLDNYCLAHRIGTRRRWEEVWEAEDEERSLLLNEIRCKVLHVLEPMILSRNLFSVNEEEKHRICVKERTQVLRQMLETHSVGDQMIRMAEELAAEGRPETSEEYEMTEKYVVSLLDEMDALLGEECISLAEFSDILDAGLSEAKLGMIPQSLDRVQVGDIMRSRLGEIRVLIVLGFNEGLIPGAAVGQGILSEAERSFLAESDLILAPTAEHVANQEQFYLYRLMTAPSDKLIISCSRMAGDGKARHISHLVDPLQRIFPGLVPGEGKVESSGRGLQTPRSAWTYFSSHFHDLKKDPEDLYLLSLGECLRRADRERMDQILKAAYDPERMDSIGRSAAAALYGQTISGSITRLELFAACAYAHFLNYGLHLEPREDGSFRAADRGEYFHRILETFFRLCAERELDIRQLEEEQRNGLVEEAFQCAEEIPGMSKLENNPENAYKLRRWKLLADQTIQMICGMLEAEAFVPKQVEMRFTGCNCKALRLDLGEGRMLDLNGKVDRLDTMEKDQETYLRVVDYKTGKKEMDLTEIYHGLQMQLPMYMTAVLEVLSRNDSDREMIPGGIFYYHVDEPYVDGEEREDPESVRGKLMKALTMKGMILDEPDVKEQMPYAKGEPVGREQFRLLGKHVKTKAQEFGKAVLDGDIEVNPYRRKTSQGCEYCGFSGICGFNSRRAGSRYRKLDEIKKETLWNMLEEEDDGR